MIIDAKSLDDTLLIAQGYAKASGKMKMVSEKDNGIYDAMNKGIKMARGEWLYFMGADDSLKNKNVLSAVVNHLDKDAGIVYGNSIWMPENRKEEGEWGYRRLLNMSINHQRIFYRRTLFEKYGDFNLLYKIAADYELNIRFFCHNGIQKKHIDLAVANYHSSGYSFGKVDEDFWENWKPIMLKNFTPHLPQKEIYNRLSWYCWHQLHQKKYSKSWGLFCSIYFNTFSFSFVKHTLSQLIKSIRNNVTNDKERF